MRVLPIPDYTFKKLTDISPQFLQEKGIRLLMLDLDNTIAPYGCTIPTPSVCRWVKEIKAAGITLFIVSNTHKDRPELFSAALEIPFIKAAKKPSVRSIQYVLDQMKLPPTAAALAGDQVYTDGLAARRAGVLALVIQPISLCNPFLAVRYAVETPFRLLCKHKIQGCVK
jgi:HAD superfamily phosphatase (TIGR01668 family)